MEGAAYTAKNSTPKKFTEKMEWMDWKAKFTKFLKYQLGRNGVPLNYVISDNMANIVRTNTNFLDDYVDGKPLPGRVLMPMHPKYIHRSSD